MDGLLPDSYPEPEYPPWTPPAVVPDDWEFRYKEYDEAPMRHRRVMDMAQNLIDPEIIADALDVEQSWVEKVMDHPPNKHLLDELKFRQEHILQIASMSMGEVILKGVAYGNEVMNDPKAPHRQKMDVIKLALDHYPNDTFARRSKVDQTHTHMVQSEGQLRDLLKTSENAKKALERDRARAIDIQPNEIENLLEDDDAPDDKGK